MSALQVTGCDPTTSEVEAGGSGADSHSQLLSHSQSRPAGTTGDHFKEPKRQNKTNTNLGKVLCEKMMLENMNSLIKSGQKGGCRDGSAVERTVAALLGGPRLVPSTHVVAHICNSGSRRSNALFCPSKARHTGSAYNV